MQQKARIFWITITVLGAFALAGFAGMSMQGPTQFADLPNDRANHHPVNPAN